MMFIREKGVELIQIEGKLLTTSGLERLPGMFPRARQRVAQRLPRRKAVREEPEIQRKR
jgi:hypothetical protein